MIAMLVPNDKLDILKEKLNVDGIIVEEKNSTDEFLTEFTTQLLAQSSLAAIEKLGEFLLAVV